MRARTIGQNLNTLDDIKSAISQLSHLVDQALSNGLTLVDNLDCVKFTVTDSGAANTAIQINHGLGRAPSGYIITKQSQPGAIYTSGTDLGTASGAVIFTSGTNSYIEGFLF